MFPQTIISRFIHESPPPRREGMAANFITSQYVLEFTFKSHFKKAAREGLEPSQSG
jgi:hypothetical protein